MDYDVGSDQKEADEMKKERERMSPRRTPKGADWHVFDRIVPRKTRAMIRYSRSRRAWKKENK